MIKSIPSAILAFFMLAFAGAGAIAAEKGKVVNQIESVDAKAHTITVYLGPSKSVTYKVAEKARIMVNNKTAEFDALKPQMKAFVGHKAGSDTADSVNAQTLVKGGRGGHKH